MLKQQRLGMPIRISGKSVCSKKRKSADEGAEQSALLHRHCRHVLSESFLHTPQT
jgi:hypothetical protein